MFIYPRLSEVLFQYEETDLKFLDTCNIVSKLGEDYFSYKLNQIETNYNLYSDVINKCLEKKQIKNDSLNDNNHYQNQIIELQNINKDNKIEINYDKSFEYLVAYRKCRAFVNFNKLIASITSDISQDLYVNERHDILPEDLTPLYSKRLLKQVENYEIRMFDIRAKLHTDQTKINKDEKYELLKNREKLLNGLKDFIAEKDIDEKKFAIKCNLNYYSKFFLII
jgi:hypothetical protein